MNSWLNCSVKMSKAKLLLITCISSSLEMFTSNNLSFLYHSYLIAACVSLGRERNSSEPTVMS